MISSFTDIRRIGSAACWLLLVGCVDGWFSIGRAEERERPSQDPGPNRAAQLEFFETKVRPLLAEHCYECHSATAKKLQAGLRLDSRTGLLEGGDSGAAVIPGDAQASLLIQSVNYESYEMPPKGKLSTTEIETLRHWVELGAVWPDEMATDVSEAAATFDLRQRAQSHWAWQPLRIPDLPPVQDADWSQTDIDRFVLAKLEQAGLAPAVDVDRSTLLRRLSFDLLGLPPEPDMVAAFLSDTRPDALEVLVDGLLQSPHFGERWGRHWLDLVRYAESRGHEFDDDAENAFQYRDYIIRALNADVPYDQLMREHIAGDLLLSPRLHPTEGFNESILGTGFWFLGEWVHSPVDVRKDETDRFDNMIDVMSKAFLGVTVACARCHDHKFDAISTADYYALSGFLQSSDFRQVRFDSLEQNRNVAKQLTALDEDFRQRLEPLIVDSEPSTSLLRENAAIGQAAESNEVDMAGVCDRVAVDYGAGQMTEFWQDGYLFGSRPRRAGELMLVDAERSAGLAFAPRSAAVSDPFWMGLKSIGEKGVQSRSALAKLPRSGRTLRTPTFELRNGDVVCRVHGSGHVVACVDSHRLIAGPLHAETVVAIKPDTQWVNLKLGRYVGHRLHLEFTPDEQCQLEVSAVLQGATADDQQVIEQREKQQQQLADKRQQALNNLLNTHVTLRESVAALTSAWRQQRLALQSTVQKTSRLAMAMLDGPGEDEHVLIRGSSANPGRLEPRHFLTALEGDRPLPISHGSGRLELVERMNDPANPLTSRVITNRLWHYLMGRGIVPTTDDFGALGQPPTHPELLDYLAVRFVEEDYSLKRAIRSIVLSRVYRMSGQADMQATRIDPNNLLWQHRAPKRLEGEAIRDALLAVSGKLNPAPFGEPVPIHLTPFMDGRGRPAASGPLDGNARRSIYIAVRRNFLSPFMLTFDTPSPFSTMGRRTSSNVPAQALILMNDPFVIEQARNWAERGLASVTVEGLEGERSFGQTTPTRVEALVEWFYLTGFARGPTPPELAAARGYLTAQATARGLAVDDVELWKDFAHALINTKEFIFLR